MIRKAMITLRFRPENGQKAKLFFIVTNAENLLLYTCMQYHNWLWFKKFFGYVVVDHNLQNKLLNNKIDIWSTIICSSKMKVRSEIKGLENLQPLKAHTKLWTDALMSFRLLTTIVINNVELLLVLKW